MKLIPVICALLFGSLSLSAQTLYVPSGTVGTSTNGYVGIGTASPGSVLTIRQDLGTAYYAQLELLPAGGGTSSTSLTSKLRFRATFDNYPADQGPRVAAQLQAGYSGGVWGQEYLAFQVGASNDSSKDPAERVRITASGNVGIGTSSPAASLQVAGYSSVDGFSNVIAKIGSGGAIVFGSITGNTAYIGTNTASANGLRFYTNGTPASPVLQLTNTGNVGIGTTNPTQKLSVNGTIRAKEVIVDTGWSDYVFAPDYRLAPLSEVEQQIKTEGHLPGIPSAAEVAEHGINVGEMQAKLLAKIEELTLHQIEQEKRLVRLEQENAGLRARYAIACSSERTLQATGSR